jgi:type IV secretion system protein VirB5
MKKIVLCCFLLCFIDPAYAFIGAPVFDFESFMKIIEEIKQLKSSYEEAKKIYTTSLNTEKSLNGLTDLTDVGKLLNDSTFQKYLPKEYEVEISKGLIKEKSKFFAKAYDYYSREGNTKANSFYYKEFERKKRDTYQELAFGKAVYDQASLRMDALNELKQRLSSASTAKEVLDLQTRLVAESVLVQNEINKMQGLLMIQAAGARIDKQRDEEAKAKLIDEMRQ